MSDLEDLVAGQEVRVDVDAIEKRLAEMWRGDGSNEAHPLTRAALWNVVAHTSTSEHQAMATETLAKASAAVPQRTIVIRANASADSDMTSYISANCHLFGGNKQVCSEEISIVAGGDRIHRVSPIISSLLIPDMPVAVWWLGDLPGEQEQYVEALLEPADRLIVDSVHFDSAADLALISRMSERTTTAPADLNWVRLAEWRAATASIFDPPPMRRRLESIRRVRIVAGTSDESYFGQSIESLFFASWLSSQAGHVVDSTGRVEGSAGSIDYQFESRYQSSDVGGVSFVEILFDDGSGATITRDREYGVLKANVDGMETGPESVTRTRPRTIDELIVRMLKRPEGDRVFRKILPVAARMAKRIAR